MRANSNMQAISDVALGALIGLAGAALFAVSVVVYRSQKNAIGPIAVSCIKTWTALPLMVLLALLPGVASPLSLPPLTTVFLSASVLCGIVIGDTIYLFSQDMIGVAHAFPIAMSYPILTFALTILVLGETLIPGRLIGAIVTVLGIILITREQEKRQGVEAQKNTHRVLGLSLAMMTSLLYAMGATFLQVGVSEADPIVANFVRVLVGSAALVPILGVASWRGMPMPTRRATKLVAVTGFFGMGIGSLLYVAAVKLAGAAVTSVVGATAPLFAVPISLFFLKEKIGWSATVGIVATVIGVVLVVLS